MIDAAKFQQLLSAFDLGKLFNELGWDRPSLKPLKLNFMNDEFTLTCLAQKRGVAVFQCSADLNGRIPQRATLLRIEKEAKQLSHEHLLIFVDAAKTTQTWLWVSRAPGQPTATRTHTWHKGTSGESLRQKLSQIVWSLDQEEAITLNDVITGLRRAFDRDRISRAFYDQFKSEHEAFGDFIRGVAGIADKAWYASLMLNRLMFVYFIQRKGFLDGNTDYLADRMRRLREERGKGHFLSFYRQFLRRLFHEGLGKPKKARDAALSALVGEVPYLNGGLFDVHELEEANPDVDIPDEAFERLFEFFDDYDWHLDDRPLRSGNEINPDVLGYIFEKYINQKQMGAYYTKEDITEYISKNTVIPHLLEQARARCSVAFEGEASVWELLKNDPDRYIYSALRTGVVDEKGATVLVSALPDFVQNGMREPKTRLFDRRFMSGQAAFNTATGEQGTLPGETWRDYVERRTRCLGLRSKLAAGEVRTFEDLITYNLNTRQFAQDIVDSCTSTDLLRAIWQSIVGRQSGRAGEGPRQGITVLDPTCGSGAFLFAALNVLEPLYEACLDRMESFVEDAKKVARPVEDDFVKVLQEASTHPSRRYFIYKAIIVHNLFGVDIMAEAVEICKLRLFLKLVSQVEEGRELEPLPDIDFNIRTGNSLVGYATEEQFDAAHNLASDEKQRTEIKRRIAELAELFNRFRDQQTLHGGSVSSADKKALRQRLERLRFELDQYLAAEYGVSATNAKAFARWRESHTPFHWFAEFYAVMREGGFDVIVGNPPYVEIPKDYNRSLLRALYRTSLERWSRDEDLYTLVTERSLSVASKEGKLGLILPLSLAFSTKKPFIALRNLMNSDAGDWWWTHYDRIPSALFGNDVRVRCSIALLSRSQNTSDRPQRHSSALMRWNVEQRDQLFQKITYSKIDVPLSEGIPKTNSQLQADVLSILMSDGRRLGEDLRTPLSFSYLATSAPNFPDKAVYVGGVAYNWFPAWRSIPKTTTADGDASLPARTAGFRFSDVDEANIVFALLCSSLGYWWWAVASDGFNLKKWLLQRFPLSQRSLSPKCRSELADLGRTLAKELRGQYVYKDNRGRIGNYYLPACQATIDKIDACLAKYVPPLTSEFFLDIRDFNASFSTAEVDDGEGGDDGDGE